MEQYLHIYYPLGDNSNPPPICRVKLSARKKRKI